MKKISLGILETGKPPVEYAAEFGSYPDMIKQLLARNSPSQELQIETKYFHVLDGALDANAVQPTDCDAWVISGSKFGVYEQHDWLQALTLLIQKAYAQDIPMIGICFGHQILAQALGGVVVKSDKGWSLGVTQYQTKALPQWIKQPQENFKLQAYHQDQVIELPADTTVIAQSNFCPFAALNFNNKAISFQGHPEFEADYTSELLKSRRDKELIPSELADTALAGINEPLDNHQIAQWIYDFLAFKLLNKC